MSTYGNSWDTLPADWAELEQQYYTTPDNAPLEMQGPPAPEDEYIFDEFGNIIGRRKPDGTTEWFPQAPAPAPAAPVPAAPQMDSWESPQNVEAGVSTVSGEPLGQQAAPAQAAPTYDLPEIQGPTTTTMSLPYDAVAPPPPDPSMYQQFGFGAEGTGSLSPEQQAALNEWAMQQGYGGEIPAGSPEEQGALALANKLSAEGRDDLAQEIYSLLAGNPPEQSTFQKGMGLVGQGIDALRSVPVPNAVTQGLLSIVPGGRLIGKAMPEAQDPLGSTKYGTLYDYADRPSDIANEQAVNLLGDNAYGRTVGAGLNTLLDPLTLAGAPLVGGGALANLLGRGSMGLAPYALGSFGSGALPQAGEEAGLPAWTQIPLGAAGFIGGAALPGLAEAAGRGMLSSDALQRLALEEAGNVKLPGDEGGIFGDLTPEELQRMADEGRLPESKPASVPKLSPEAQPLQAAEEARQNFFRERYKAGQPQQAEIKAELNLPDSNAGTRTANEVQAVREGGSLIPSEEGVLPGPVGDRIRKPIWADVPEPAVTLGREIQAPTPEEIARYQAEIRAGRNPFDVMTPEQRAGVNANEEMRNFLRVREQVDAQYAASGGSGIPPYRRPPTGGEPPLPNPESLKPGGFWKTVGQEIQGLLSAPIALKASVTPPVLRQGIVRLITAPLKAIDEVAVSLKAGLTEEDARAVMQAIFDDPRIGGADYGPFRGFTAKDVNLKFREWGPDAAATARVNEFAGITESRIGRAVESLPWVKISDRQYALEQNLHLGHRYAETMTRALDAGYRDPRTYEWIARVLEHHQQIGAVGGGWIPWFFSPRGISGRAQAIIDMFRFNPVRAIFEPASRPAAIEAWKGGIALVAGNLTMMYLAAEALPGFDVDTSYIPPRLKTPAGTIDPWAGWGTIARLVYDVGDLIQKDIGDGSIDDLGPDFVERAARFLRGQESPSVSKITDFATGENYRGRPYSISDDVTSGSFFTDLTAPMIVDQIVEGYRNYGVAGAIGGAAWSGFGGQINQEMDAFDKADRDIPKLIGKETYTNADGKEVPYPTSYVDPRDGKTKQVKDYQSLLEADSLAAEDYRRKHPEIAKGMTDLKSEPSQNIQALRDEQLQRQQAIDNIADPKAWRKARSELSTEIAAKIQQEAKHFADDPKTDSASAAVAKKYGDAIEAAKDPGTKAIDWNKVDAVVAAMSPREQEILRNNRLLNETEKSADYLRDLSKLDEYFQVRDKAWETIVKKKPELAEYKSYDDYHDFVVQKFMSKGLGYTEADVAADEYLGVYSDYMQAKTEEFFTSSRDHFALLPTLDKWGFYIPADFRPYARPR